MYLIDSNVLIDVANPGSVWTSWSSAAVQQAIDRAEICINPVIYAEVSIVFPTEQHTDTALAALPLKRLAVPYPAAFLAGKAFLAYRRAGGLKHAPLPDFLIGAHAAVADLTLVTRDPRPYRSYFPTVRLIAPA